MLPVLSKITPIMKYLELVKQQLCKMMGVCGTPLSYVVQTDFVPGPVTKSPLRPNSSTFLYRVESNSLHDDLITRIAHGHPGYAKDNSYVLDVSVQSLG